MKYTPEERAAAVRFAAGMRAHDVPARVIAKMLHLPVGTLVSWVRAHLIRRGTFVPGTGVFGETPSRWWLQPRARRVAAHRARAMMALGHDLATAHRILFRQGFKLSYDQLWRAVHGDAAAVSLPAEPELKKQQ